MNKYFAGNYDISGNGSIGAEDHPTGAGDVGNIIGGADTTRSFDDLKFEYDFARQAMRITQTGDDTIHLTSDTAITGELFGAYNLATSSAFSDRQARATAITAVAAQAQLSSADGDNAVVLTKTMVPPEI